MRIVSLAFVAGFASLMLGAAPAQAMPVAPAPADSGLTQTVQGRCGYGFEWSRYYRRCVRVVRRPVVRPRPVVCPRYWAYSPRLGRCIAPRRY